MKMKRNHRHRLNQSRKKFLDKYFYSFLIVCARYSEAVENSIHYKQEKQQAKKNQPLIITTNITAGNINNVLVTAILNNNNDSSNKSNDMSCNNNDYIDALDNNNK